MQVDTFSNTGLLKILRFIRLVYESIRIVCISDGISYSSRGSGKQLARRCTLNRCSNLPNVYQEDELQEIYGVIKEDVHSLSTAS